MDLFEHQAKELFAKHGVAVPRGKVAWSPEEAETAAAEIGGGGVGKGPGESGGGGVEIEQVAAEKPEAIVKVLINPLVGLRSYHVNQLVYGAGFDERARKGAAELLARLYEVFLAADCMLVEVNPLVLTGGGQVFAVDPQEQAAKEKGLNYIKLDGHVGIIGNGAGLVMSTLDVVAQAGGKAANFLDVGGGASAETMTDGLEVILSDDKVRSVLVNIFGGITRGDLVGQDVDGIPVFNTVVDAVAEAGANTSLVFVPARFAVDALYEAVDAGIATVVLVTENIPVLDMTRAYNYVRAKGVALVGPNCPGVISPGKANVGIIPGEITHAGPVGLVSRSGTLTYQVMYEMAAAGVGQTTCVGIGGDPVVGSSFTDVLGRFQDDPETEAVVMIGEIGGDEEERAARFISDRMDKPVVAYIAGFEAPPGKRMGHAGAIISGSSGTAQAKADALEAAGVRVGRNPTEAAELAVAAVSPTGPNGPVGVR